MMTRNANLARPAIVAALALSMVLAGCKQDRGEPDDANAADTGAASSAGSIIREDAATAPVPPPVEVVVEPLVLTIPFDGVEGSDFPQATQAALNTLVASEQLALGGAIIVRGHSDAAGGKAANLAASQERADTVKDYLINAGIDERRVTVIALGGQNPAQPNARPDGSPNETGRAANRRVTVRIEVPRAVPSANAGAAGLGGE